MRLQVPDPFWKGDAEAAQSLLPALLSSQPLKSKGHCCCQAGPGLALGGLWKGEHRAWNQGTWGQVSRDKDTCCGAGVSEGATSLLRWGQCSRSVHLHHSSPTWVLSHPAMASHRHSSRHVMLSPAVCLDHIIPNPSHKGSTFRDRHHRRPWPCPGGTGAQADYSSALGGIKAAAASSSQGARHPSVWRLVGLGTLPCTPELCRAQPTLSIPQDSTNTHGSQRGEQCPNSGTELGCATSCHRDLGGTGRRCSWQAGHQ